MMMMIRSSENVAVFFSGVPPQACCRHFEKSNNRRISAAVRAISKKFGTVKQFDVLGCFDY